VYWGTPKVEDALEAREWPRVYRERNEIQEHSFKGMIDHGGLGLDHGVGHPSFLRGRHKHLSTGRKRRARIST
jgi:hypothetical protein